MIDRLAPIRQRQARRQARTRTQMARQPNQRPRLSVHISGRHIRAQVIDDRSGQTKIFVSTLKEPVIGSLTTKAEAVGKQVGQLCKKAGIEAVNFDRGRRLYHGRIKALAEAARAEGLKF